MPRGKILEVEDQGTVWSVLYRPEDGGLDRVAFDWRQFANFYEGTSGRSFYRDYCFGAGREGIKNYFQGKILIVDGDDFEERVRLED
jgi:hypothetical protein